MEKLLQKLDTLKATELAALYAILLRAQQYAAASIVYDAGLANAGTEFQQIVDDFRHWSN